MMVFESRIDAREGLGLGGRLEGVSARLSGSAFAVGPLNDLRSHPVRVLAGSFLMLTWFAWFDAPEFFVGEGTGRVGLSFFTLPTLLVCAVLGAVGKDCHLPTRVLNALSAAGATAASLVIVLAPPAHADGGSLSFIALAALGVGGMSLGWLVLQWAAAFSRVSVRTALLSAMVAELGKTALVAVFVCLPSGVADGIVCFFPLLSLVPLRNSSSLGSAATPMFTGADCLQLWRVVASVSLAGFVCMAVRYGVAPLAGWGFWGIFGASMLELFVLAVLLAYIFLLKRPFGSAQYFGIAFLLMTVAIIFVSVLPLRFAGLMVSTSSFFLVYLGFWLVLCDVVHYSKFSPYLVFGLCWSFYIAGKQCGLLLANSFPFSDRFAIVLLGSIVVSLLLLFGTGNPFFRRIFSELGDSKIKLDDLETIDKRCVSVAEEYGLTNRELEVMQLICKGRSKPYIAETLFVSESTVRGHSAKLYAKLGVHSKAELQKLIGL